MFLSKTYHVADSGKWEVVPAEDIVEPEFACPSCNENRVDELHWVDDVTVYCQTCGTEYDID